MHRAFLDRDAALELEHDGVTWLYRPLGGIEAQELVASGTELDQQRYALRAGFLGWKVTDGDVPMVPSDADERIAMLGAGAYNAVVRAIMEATAAEADRLGNSSSP